LGGWIVLLLIGCEVVVRGECSSLLYELSKRSRFSKAYTKDAKDVTFFLGASGCVCMRAGWDGDFGVDKVKSRRHAPPALQLDTSLTSRLSVKEAGKKIASLK
jgi:hypothetical protein